MMRFPGRGLKDGHVCNRHLPADSTREIHLDEYLFFNARILLRSTKFLGAVPLPEVGRGGGGTAWDTADWMPSVCQGLNFAL